MSVPPTTGSKPTVPITDVKTKDIKVVDTCPGLITQAVRISTEDDMYQLNDLADTGKWIPAHVLITDIGDVTLNGKFCGNVEVKDAEVFSTDDLTVRSSADVTVHGFEGNLGSMKIVNE